MNFGKALESLKEGKRVSREGWNGKEQWLIIIEPGNAMHTSGAGKFDMQACIGLKNFQNNMQPGWVPSQGDLFAEDWGTVED